MVARTRHYPVRVGAAVVISGGQVIAAWPHFSVWPAIWFVAAVFCHTFEDRLDHYLLAKFVTIPDNFVRFGITWAAVCSFVYCSSSILFWFLGPLAKAFSIVILCGSMLHVCVTLQRSALTALVCVLAVTPIAVGLPVFDALHGHATIKDAILVSACWFFYLATLGVLVAEARGATRSLRNATADALEQRQIAEAQRQIAETANKTKSMFLATISHEIRTPLNAVTSAAHLLGRIDLSREGREYVSILLNGSEVLLSLINDVLDMSKIEAGKITLEEGDADLAMTAQKLITLWTPKAAERSLTLAVELDPTLPQAIRVDELRLTQILFNLISNAVKFTTQGGVRVTIRQTESLDGITDCPGVAICFEVTDTGPGMTEDMVQRLFQSFEQAHVSVARKFGGTGLGLAISRRLAELMGGALTAETTLGVGSTFRLTLPLRAVEIADRPHTPSKAMTTRSLTPIEILLVEDHPINRQLVGLFLEPLGYILTEAQDGLEAVALAATRPFDLILMDMQMPVMDGLEATAQIRGGAGPNCDTPIVALTADAFDDRRDAWIAAGAAAFLTKPINPDLLLETVSRLTAGADHPPVSQASQPSAA
jgi:signal transduction histidine kinase/CheY-like chemotaxis protein